MSFDYSREPLTQTYLDAAAVGNEEKVRECITKGVDIETQNVYGSSALHLASWNGHFDIVVYLIDDCKCNINLLDNSGESAYDFAIKNKKHDVAEYLLKEKKDNMKKIFDSAINGDLDTLIEYTEQGKVDVEKKDETGCTILHYASYHGQIEIVKYLVDICHADVFITTNQGETSYYLAKLNQKHHVADYLLSVSRKTKPRNDIISASHTIPNKVTRQVSEQSMEKVQYTEQNDKDTKGMHQMIDDDFHHTSPTLSTKENRISNIDETVISFMENFELNENSINELLQCYDSNHQFVDALDKINLTNQFTSDSYTILQQLIVEKCNTQQDIIEQKAILDSTMHRDFYILLNRKLYSMINACESLTSGMIASNGNGNSFRSYVSHVILRDRSIDALKTTRIGLLIGSALNWAKKNVAIVPFADTIGSIFQLIVTLKDERDRYLSIARVADFATMACLNRNSDGSEMNLRNVVEKCSRLIVCARHGLPNCECLEEETDQFGRIKQYMLFLLAESGNTVPKEQACKAADCAFAHIMKPNKESILYDVLYGDDIDTTLEEALAATILNISVQTLRSLEPFTSTSSALSSVAASLSTTTPAGSAISTSVAVTTTALARTSVTCANGDTIQDQSADNFNVVRDKPPSELSDNAMPYNAFIEQHNKEIDQLKEKIRQLEKKQSSFKPNYDAGGGFVYVNPTEQTDSENELAMINVTKELATTDRRVGNVELSFYTLLERVSILEQKTETTIVTSKHK